MVNLEITGPEATLLRSMLARDLGELRVEVNHTDRLDDRRDLQRTEATIKSLIARLDALAVPTPQ